MQLKQCIALLLFLYQGLSHATIYWPEQDLSHLSCEEPVLIFDAISFLVDRHFHVPLVLLCHLFDTMHQQEFLDALPTILSTCQQIKPIPHTKSLNIFIRFGKISKILVILILIPPSTCSLKNILFYKCQKIERFFCRSLEASKAVKELLAMILLHCY